MLSARGVALQLSNAARLWLVDKGYQPAYGARPLKRVIKTELQNKLAHLLLSGDVHDGSVIHADVMDDVLIFKTQIPKEKSKSKVA